MIQDKNMFRKDVFVGKTRKLDSRRDLIEEHHSESPGLSCLNSSMCICFILSVMVCHRSMLFFQAIYIYSYYILNNITTIPIQSRSFVANVISGGIYIFLYYNYIIELLFRYNRDLLSRLVISGGIYIFLLYSI